MYIQYIHERDKDSAANRKWRAYLPAKRAGWAKDINHFGRKNYKRLQFIKQKRKNIGCS